MLKKHFYIFLVMLLLAVTSSFLYGSTELFVRSGSGDVVVVIFLIVVAGMSIGARWWNYIYVEKKYTNKYFDQLFKSSSKE